MQPLIDIARETARQHGRPPEALETSTGCPDALPNSGNDPVEAVAKALEHGIDRVYLPLPAFMPNLEDNLRAFGDQVAAKFN